MAYNSSSTEQDLLLALLLQKKKWMDSFSVKMNEIDEGQLNYEDAKALRLLRTDMNAMKEDLRNAKRIIRVVEKLRNNSDGS